MRVLKRVAIGAGVAAAAALAISQVTADAHHADVEVSCIDAPGTIRIIARAWDSQDPNERVNNRVEIAYDGKVIATVALTKDNGYTAVVDYVAPEGTGTHVVRATATVRWGADQDDEDPIGVGEYREATIKLPCAEVEPSVTSSSSTTTASTSTTSTTVAWTTPSSTTSTTAVTVPPVTAGAVTTTTAPAQVLGISVVAQPVTTSPRFTG